MKPAKVMENVSMNRIWKKVIQQGDKSYIKCECLDFVEASHQNRVYPVMYCHMEITGKFDIGKLKNAVQISGEYIPEILYSYDFKRNRFINRGFTAEDVVQTNPFRFEDNIIWDLSRYPQLRIVIHCAEGRSRVIFCMSHILSDGSGFLQYVYLLASLYNGCWTENQLKNKRDISWLLKGIHVQRQTEQMKYGKSKHMEPLRSSGIGTEHYLIKRTISSPNFKKLHNKAKRYHVTLNDVFMTAYARVIARIQHRDQVMLPCPADLRKFAGHEKTDLTVANMTGIYRNVVINCESRYDFTTILLQVHIEMELQKSRFRCFKGIQILDSTYRILPDFILGKIIRATYQLPSVSYTNIGIIEHQKLYFRECEIEDCVMTGAYRQSPDFQLTVSSFRNVCTLNCTLIGDGETKIEAENILERVEKELLEWGEK